MRLPAFIETIGDDAAAELFEVPVRTVASWRYGDRRPRPTKAHVIVERTEGKVTFPEIYEAA